MSEKLVDLISEYFDIGVAQGRAGRDYDNTAADAQRVLFEINDEIFKLGAEIKRLTRVATDRQYMMLAYTSMLGPIGLEVVSEWDKKGVTRFHASWGPDAVNLSGEERAKVLLDAHNQVESDNSEVSP